MKHIEPKIRQVSFHCPNCRVLSEQTWSDNIECKYIGLLPNGGRGHTHFNLQNTLIAKCTHCEQPNIWLNNKMIYPLIGNVEIANEDMPDDIKNDYNEAQNIVCISPRGAAALLRLAVQKLCIHLGEKGENINDDIKNDYALNKVV